MTTITSHALTEKEIKMESYSVRKTISYCNCSIIKFCKCYEGEVITIESHAMTLKTLKGMVRNLHLQGRDEWEYGSSDFYHTTDSLSEAMAVIELISLEIALPIDTKTTLLLKNGLMK